MTVDNHFRKLERMYLSAANNEYYQPKIEIEDARAIIRIPVRKDFYHVAGAVHGSVYFKALDDAAFFAASSLVHEVFLLTTSFNTYLLRPVNSGILTATGTVVHRSKRLFVAAAILHDSDGREVGRGSGTFVPSRIALAPKLGYV